MPQTEITFVANCSISKHKMASKYHSLSPFSVILPLHSYKYLKIPKIFNNVLTHTKNYLKYILNSDRKMPHSFVKMLKTHPWNRVKEFGVKRKDDYSKDFNNGLSNFRNILEGKAVIYLNNFPSLVANFSFQIRAKMPEMTQKRETLI